MAVSAAAATGFTLTVLFCALLCALRCRRALSDLRTLAGSLARAIIRVRGGSTVHAASCSSSSRENSALLTRRGADEPESPSSGAVGASMIEGSSCATRTHTRASKHAA